MNIEESELARVRQVRLALQDEEELTSYRRRLLHAQIDLLDAGLTPGRTFSVDDLVRVLADTGAGGTRRSVTTIQSRGPFLDPVELGAILATDPGGDDADSVASALVMLRAAEQVLTDRRRELHRLIDEATQDLIARYRSDPQLALSIIPVG